MPLGKFPKSAMGDGRQGKWGKTPGKEIFRSVKALGDLPFIAEDLGEITPDVDAFREDLGFMGMKILHLPSMITACTNISHII